MGRKVEHIHPTLYSDGLTKREWFAGQALALIDEDSARKMTPVQIADWCYKIADAMIDKS